MRTSICLPHYGTQEVLQHGDTGFASEIDRLYVPTESKALDDLNHLKAKLRRLDGDDFFAALTEGMADVFAADMAFVMKRIVVDETPFGEDGSCMMAAAFHYRASDGSKDTIKHSKFAAYGCPCQYMRHDKVFVIPERLGQFITNNPNEVPVAADSYIGLPLFVDDKNIGHFGLMWSVPSNEQRKLSWAFIELALTSLEDMILQKLASSSNLVKPSAMPERQCSLVPQDAVAMARSLRPYAGSLSHELRTPMQGVVGMLDVIYMNVEEAKENADTVLQRQRLDVIRQNIEVVQDSSRRAIEAADNVVHAYDMDMGLPVAPQSPFDDAEPTSPHLTGVTKKRPDIVVAGSNLPLDRPNKRRWDEAFSRQSSNASAAKLPRVEDAQSTWAIGTETSQDIKDGLHEADVIQSCAHPAATPDDAPTAEDVALAKAAMHPTNRIIAPGLRHTSMREVFQYVINEGLKMGGRPDMALAQETDTGETIEVRSRGSDGSVKTKWIEWSVDPAIPRTIFVDEKNVSKLVSCVFLNAIKFTDQDGGRVRVEARMSTGGKYIEITVADNGPGIPAAFVPKLFTAFSRNEVSITRHSEGLGLGLLVAKGTAIKLGGELVCARADTEGDDHGTDFEMWIPLLAGDTITRPSSPFVSPVTKHAVPRIETEQTPPSPPATSNGTSSPTNLTQALNKLTDQPPISCSDDFLSTASPKSRPCHPAHKPRVPSVTVASSPPTPPNGHAAPASRPVIRKSISNPEVDRDLAQKFPLNILVVEDNKINRTVLVAHLKKLGYQNILEAHDGTEAVRQMRVPRPPEQAVNMILMDLWMPLMDGYEATQRILALHEEGDEAARPVICAVTADVTGDVQKAVAQAGMKGYLSKPYKMHDLQRLIEEYCVHHRDWEVQEPGGDGMEY